MSNKIIFNNKSNEDFGTMLCKFIPQPPEPRIIKQPVPGKSGYYDFSRVASGGEAVFDDRQIECELMITGSSRTDLNQKYSKILSWLMSGKFILTYTDEPGVQYTAQVEEKPTIEYINISNANISFNFTAEVYKQSTELAGELLWNNVDFNLPDYIQETNFNINGTMTVIIGVSSDHSVVPNVVCNSNMACTVNGYTANFTASIGTDWSFKLQPGENTIQITGTGDIDFQFRKEVL